MNSQGGSGGGNYGAAAGIGHGMLNMSMLQSLEQMIGGQSEELSMMMSGVHEQVTTGAGAPGALTALQGSVAADIGRPDSSNINILRVTGGDSGTSSVGAVPRGQAAGNSTPGGPPSRYESQKRRDWNTFGQYLKNHRPPLALDRCSGAHVLEFLRYLDQFGKTKVHAAGCPFFGHPQPPAPCACPLRQAWGSLDALIGRLRAAYEEHGGRPESNPFGARAVRLYLRQVRETQAKARGIAYEKKKRKRPPPPPPPPGASSSSATHAAAGAALPATDHSQFGQPPASAPNAPPGAPPTTHDHQSLLSGSSSLLIPSFN